MPKKSVKRRNQKRKDLVAKFATLREKLKRDMRDARLSSGEIMSLRAKFHKLPRDTSPTRYRNRCLICGRARAYNRVTGMCRFHMRALINVAEAPGMVKNNF